MRPFFASLLLSAVAAAQTQPSVGPDAEQKKIRLEGRVLSSTGEPVRRASVLLQPANNNNAPRGADPLPNFTDTTGDDGKFVFEDVKPGTYSLRAERTGFVGQRYGARTSFDNGTPLSLKEGNKLTNLDIKLTQQAVILGRVTDTEGDGVPGIQVRAARFSYVGGVRQFRSEGTGGATDDEGNFRISALSPGRYYVVADTQIGSRQQMLNPALAGRAAAAPTNLMSTYFPASLDLRGATAVEAGPGSHVSADIRMRRERVFTVRGVAVANGAPVAHALIALMADEELPSAAPSNGAFVDAVLPFNGFAQTDDQGRFELRNVMPGQHTLRAMRSDRVEISSPTGGMSMTSTGRTNSADVNGYLQVNVPAADMNNVVFSLDAKPGEIATRVSLDGGILDDLKKDLPKPQSPAPNITPQIYLPSVRLAPNATTYVNGPSANTNPDGTQRITNLTPGRYFINPTNLPQGYYVKSMRFGGTDVTRSQLEFTGGSGELEITVAKGAGDITGTVTNGDGGSVSGVTVSLWPKTPNLSTPAQGARVVTTDQTGGFKFTGTSPEEYYVVAFEEVPDSGLAQYTGFLNAFTADAVSITLAPSGAPTASPRVIGRDKVLAALSKLQL